MLKYYSAENVYLKVYPDFADQASRIFSELYVTPDRSENCEKCDVRYTATVFVMSNKSNLNELCKNQNKSSIKKIDDLVYKVFKNRNYDLKVSKISNSEIRFSVYFTLSYNVYDTYDIEVMGNKLDKYVKSKTKEI